MFDIIVFELGLFTGLVIGVTLTKIAYKPFIAELKQSINYWYDYSRTKKVN